MMTAKMMAFVEVDQPTGGAAATQNEDTTVRQGREAGKIPADNRINCANEDREILSQY